MQYSLFMPHFPCSFLIIHMPNFLFGLIYFISYISDFCFLAILHPMGFMKQLSLLMVYFLFIRDMKILKEFKVYTSSLEFKISIKSYNTITLIRINLRTIIWLAYNLSKQRKELYIFATEIKRQCSRFK